MGLEKWVGNIPNYNDPVVYKQFGQTYGEQLEILSVTLRDKTQSDSDWYIDCDYKLDIVDYWQNPEHVSAWLQHLKLTPVHKKVEDFCKLVSASNQLYYNGIIKCQQIVDDIVLKKVRDINLNFYETAVCHSMLLRHYNVSHIDCKLLKTIPTSTSHLMEILP